MHPADKEIAELPGKRGIIVQVSQLGPGLLFKFIIVPGLLVKIFEAARLFSGSFCAK
jgi:hypothetical protein